MLLAAGRRARHQPAAFGRPDPIATILDRVVLPQRPVPPAARSDLAMGAVVRARATGIRSTRWVRVSIRGKRPSPPPRSAGFVHRPQNDVRPRLTAQAA